MIFIGFILLIFYSSSVSSPVENVWKSLEDLDLNYTEFDALFSKLPSKSKMSMEKPTTETKKPKEVMRILLPL